MRLASVLHDDVPRAVAIDGDRALAWPGVAELGPDSLPGVLTGARPGGGDSLALADLRLRPVIPRPAKVICVGLNYLEHVNETRRDVPAYPVLFTKFASSLTGAFDAIPCPPESTAIDYEGELVVVIGRRARRVAPAAAMSVVAGYSVANDISMRDFQNLTHQWLQGKAWDASTPGRPVSRHRGRGRRSGRAHAAHTRQRPGRPGGKYRSAHLRRPHPGEPASPQFTTLEPGDLILTGTPGGVGFRREPPRLLGPGDVVAVEIDRVGRIENTMVAEEG